MTAPRVIAVSVVLVALALASTWWVRWVGDGLASLSRVVLG